MSSQSIQILLTIGISLVAMFFCFWAGHKNGYEECYKDTVDHVKNEIRDNQIFS